MRTTALALLVAAVLAATARWGSFVAGGSDSFCYLHQAERWASGQLQVVEPLALQMPWPGAPQSFTPVGHVPSPTVPGAIVPICPAGLSILMALAILVGGSGAALLVVPLCGAVLLLATAALGGRFSPRVGVAAAALLACSPVFVYQVLQPMSDVPAAAFWTVAVACATGTSRRAGTASGLAAGIAILVRPNLVLLGVLLGIFLLARPERPWRQRLTMAAQYAAGSAVGCVAVAAIQYQFYGSPLVSGYGPLATLFAVDHVVPNLSRYLAWAWETQTPFIGLAAIAPFVLPGPVTTFVLAWTAVNVALYAPYLVFDEWWTLRFLLPSIPLCLVLAAASADALMRRMTAVSRRAAGVGQVAVAIGLAVAVAVVSVAMVREAANRQTFRLRQMEARFQRAGTFVAARLPANAVVIASVHSGSVRYYAGRVTLVWDQLDPAWLQPAVAALTARGLAPFFLFEAGEEAPFRARFGRDGASPLARLDWPPMAEVASLVRVYAPDDRDLYLQGRARPTEYVP